MCYRLWLWPKLSNFFFFCIKLYLGHKNPSQIVSYQADKLSNFFGIFFDQLKIIKIMSSFPIASHFATVIQFHQYLRKQLAQNSMPPRNHPLKKFHTLPRSSIKIWNFYNFSKKHFQKLPLVMGLGKKNCPPPPPPNQNTIWSTKISLKKFHINPTSSLNLLEIFIFQKSLKKFVKLFWASKSTFCFILWLDSIIIYVYSKN